MYSFVGRGLKKYFAMHFGKNIQLLRKRRGISQDMVAHEIGVQRTSLSGYESGAVQPPLKNLMALSDFFRVSIDKLLRYDLNALSEGQLTELERGYDIDLKGKKLRVLATTVGADMEDNIELLSEKAKAGYTAGYADPDFISELPTFRLPFLQKNKKYRAFPVQGDSMPPVPQGAIVVGEYLQDWTALKDGSYGILLTREDGIVFKQIYNRLEEGRLMLVSTNPEYVPYSLPVGEVLEIWLFAGYYSKEMEMAEAANPAWSRIVRELQKEVAEIKQNMGM